MKTAMLCILLLTAFVSSGCVNRYFKYTVNLQATGTWHIDQTGPFISSSFLQAKLDIPNDAEILEVNIESFTLRPRVLTGNTATGIEAEGRLNGRTLFQRQRFPFEIEGPFGVKIPIEFAPSALIDAEVAKVKQMLQNYIKDRTFPAGTSVSLNGTSIGGRALFDIEYSFNATIRYGRCEEIFVALGDVGEPCGSPTGFDPF